MRVAILGFGLIGGSIARALARPAGTEWRVTAWSRSDAGPRRALAEEVIESVAADPAAAVVGAELVVLAASPLGNLELVERVGPLLAGRDATLTDVSSVQVPMEEASRRVPGVRFVGGHPLAGREVRGYGGSDGALFVDRPWVVVPGPGASEVDLGRVEGMARACGAVPLRMEAALHDHLVAAISHLPLIVSAALAEAVTSTPDWPAAAALAAGGWRDATRVARGDPDLGAGIAAGNAGEILGWLSRLEAVLAEWRVDLERLASGGGSGAGVGGTLEATAAVAARLDRVRAALLGSSGTGATDGAVRTTGRAAGRGGTVGTPATGSHGRPAGSSDG